MGSHDTAYKTLRGVAIVTAIVAIILQGVAYFKRGGESRSNVPTAGQVYQAADLDGNGIHDIVRETQTGSKVPYFGVQVLPSGDVAYFSVSEMSQRFPENRSLYSGIEAGLNQK